MEEAWDALHDATPAGWYVGRPSVGPRSREWTAIGSTELEVVAEMARCLREIAKRKVPR